MTAESPPYPRRWQALVVLALSLLVVTSATRSSTSRCPRSSDELDASSSELQWIIDGYLLVFAGLLLAAGSLGDRFGRAGRCRRADHRSAAGSIFACFADSSTALIAARAVMGLGAAGIMPTTLSILTNIFPAHERPKAIGVWAAVSGIGIAIGPTSGGWLLEHFDWNSVFLINLPDRRRLPGGRGAARPRVARPRVARRLDLPGARLSIAGLSALVWALIEAPERGWAQPSDPRRIRAGVAIVAAFIAWERRTDHPMLDVRVFRNLRFSAASLSITFVFFALMGVHVLPDHYMQSVMGFTRSRPASACSRSPSA